MMVGQMTPDEGKTAPVQPRIQTAGMLTLVKFVLEEVRKISNKQYIYSYAR